MIDAAEIARLREAAAKAKTVEDNPNWENIGHLRNFQQAVAPSHVLSLLDALEQSQARMEAAKKALLEIAGQDDVELALDPQWAKRIARSAL